MRTIKPPLKEAQPRFAPLAQADVHSRLQVHPDRPDPRSDAFLAVALAQSEGLSERYREISGAVGMMATTGRIPEVTVSQYGLPATTVLFDYDDDGLVILRVFYDEDALCALQALRAVTGLT